jgi:aspartyl/asparaginyl-tRNA synthetase
MRNNKNNSIFHVNNCRTSDSERLISSDQFANVSISILLDSEQRGNSEQFFSDQKVHYHQVRMYFTVHIKFVLHIALLLQHSTVADFMTRVISSRNCGGVTVQCTVLQRVAILSFNLVKT